MVRLALILVLLGGCVTEQQLKDYQSESRAVHEDVKSFETKSRAITYEVHGFKESTDKLRGEVDAMRKELDAKITGVHRNVAQSRAEITKATIKSTDDALLNQAGEFGTAFTDFKNVMLKQMAELVATVNEQDKKIHGNEWLFEKYDDFRTKVLDKDRSKVVDVVLGVKKTVDAGLAENRVLHKGASARLDRIETWKEKVIAAAATLLTEQKVAKEKTTKLEVDQSAFDKKFDKMDDTVFALIIVILILAAAFLLYAIRNQLPAIISKLPFTKKDGGK